LTGDLAPGEKLKIEDLKQKLGLGATAIREALSQLSSEQLVIRLDQRGFRAAEANRADFEELLDLRCTLESKALRQSIANADDEWLESLLLVHHRMTRAKAQGREVFEQKHKDFHMALIGQSNSPLLLRFCSQLYDLNIRYRYIAGGPAGYDKRDVAAEHQAILDAVLARDVETADRLLMEHYRTTGAFLSARL